MSLVQGEANPYPALTWNRTTVLCQVFSESSMCIPPATNLASAAAHLQAIRNPSTCIQSTSMYPERASTKQQRVRWHADCVIMTQTLPTTTTMLSRHVPAHQTRRCSNLPLTCSVPAPLQKHAGAPTFF